MPGDVSDGPHDLCKGAQLKAFSQVDLLTAVDVPHTKKRYGSVDTCMQFKMSGGQNLDSNTNSFKVFYTFVCVSEEK